MTKRIVISQVLRNGTTVIHCEADGSRGVPVLLRLERSHGTLTWSRTPWNGNLSGDLSLFSNPDVDVTAGLKIKYGLGHSPPVGAGGGGMGGAYGGEVCGGGIEEGFLDVCSLKEVALHCRENELLSIARRYGNYNSMSHTLNAAERKCISIVFFVSSGSHTNVGRCSLVCIPSLRLQSQ